MMNYGEMNTGLIIFCTVAVGAIIALIVWAILRASNQSSPGGDALETLERRFANGEIDDREYARRRALLLQR